MQHKLNELEAQVYNDGLTIIFQEDKIKELEAKSSSLEAQYLEAVDCIEKHSIAARAISRQLEELHAMVTLDGLGKINEGIDILKRDLEENLDDQTD